MVVFDKSGCTVLYLFKMFNLGSGVWPQNTVLCLQVQRGDIHGDNRGTTEPKQRLPVAEFCKVIFLQTTQGTHELLQSYSLPRSCGFSLMQVLSLSKSVHVYNGNELEKIHM